MPYIGQCAEGRQILKENIVKAKPGDFIVTSQGKNFTVLHVREINDQNMIMEEITAPQSRVPRNRYTWRQWIECGAPGHTSWVMYDLNTIHGTMGDAFSYTKNCWFRIPESDNFLSRLLSLKFSPIPLKDRKRVGPSLKNGLTQDWRGVWQPKLVVNGQAISGAQFTVWKTRWPDDGSELSGKMIEAYIPEEDQRYPSYFPYWLEISGMLCKAKVRILDSGSNLQSPKPIVQRWQATIAEKEQLP